MTFDDVIAAGKVASCQLPGGARLRYDRAEGAVRALPHPGGASPWSEAKLSVELLPPSGWSHRVGCEYVCCGDATEQELGGVAVAFSALSAASVGAGEPR